MEVKKLNELCESLGKKGVRIVAEAYGWSPSNFHKVLNEELKVPVKSRYQLKRDIIARMEKDLKEDLKKIEEVLK